jgi:hypothetical protein
VKHFEIIIVQNKPLFDDDDDDHDYDGSDQQSTYDPLRETISIIDKDKVVHDHVHLSLSMPII